MLTVCVEIWIVFGAWLRNLLWKKGNNKALIASAAKSKRECSTGCVVCLRASSTFCDWCVTFVETEGNIGVTMVSVEDTVIFSTKGIRKVFQMMRSHRWIWNSWSSMIL